MVYFGPKHLNPVLITMLKNNALLFYMYMWWNLGIFFFFFFVWTSNFPLCSFPRHFVPSTFILGHYVPKKNPYDLWFLWERITLFQYFLFNGTLLINCVVWNTFEFEFALAITTQSYLRLFIQYFEFIQLIPFSIGKCSLFILHQIDEFQSFEPG